MEDFLLALLSFLLEAVLEALLEFGLGAILDVVLRRLGKLLEAGLQSEPVVMVLLFGLAGGGAGCLSLLVLPHHVVHPSRFHGISLLVSPLLTGLGMAEVGRWFRRRGQPSAAIESFGCGFAFALGVALIRLTLVK